MYAHKSKIWWDDLFSRSRYRFSKAIKYSFLFQCCKDRQDFQEVFTFVLFWRNYLDKYNVIHPVSMDEVKSFLSICLSVTGHPFYFFILFFYFQHYVVEMLEGLVEQSYRLDTRSFIQILWIVLGLLM